MTSALREFAKSPELTVALVLILVDLVLGSVAAFSNQRFHLSYLADFARQDLMKVLGWFVVFAGGAVAPGADIGVGDVAVSLSDVAVGVWAVVAVALVGSILNSLKELGVLPATLSNVLAGNEKAAPPPGPPPVS